MSKESNLYRSFSGWSSLWLDWNLQSLLLPLLHRHPLWCDSLKRISDYRVPWTLHIYLFIRPLLVEFVWLLSWHPLAIQTVLPLITQLITMSLSLRLLGFSNQSGYHWASDPQDSLLKSYLPQKSSCVIFLKIDRWVYKLLCAPWLCFTRFSWLCLSTRFGLHCLRILMQIVLRFQSYSGVGLPWNLARWVSFVV